MSTTQCQPGPEKKLLRLVRVELRAFPDGKTLALTPTGRMYRIETEPEKVYQLLEMCDGSHSLQDVLQESTHPAEFSEVLDILYQDGCLRDHDTRPAVAEEDWVRFSDESLNPAEPLATRLLLIGDPHLLSLAQDLHLTTRFASVEVATLQTLAEIMKEKQNLSTIIVALRETFDQTFLLSLNDICYTHQIQWTQFHIDQGRGWLGPAIIPGQTSDYQDVLGRRLIAAENVEVFRALTSPTLHGQSYLPPMTEIVWMLAFLFTDIERWAAGASTQTLCFEVEMDPIAFTTTSHPVLPLPHRQTSSKIFDYLVQEGRQFIYDDRTGIVTHLQKLEHHPSIPTQLTTVQSHIADVNRIYPWANNTVCSGSTFGDVQSARNAAVGEGLERYCGNWVQHVKVTQASYNELRDRGEYALDPQQMILYSEQQYHAPGFPFVPFTHDLRVHWVAGWSLTANKPAWVPASFVYVNWYTGDYKDELPTNNLFYPGLAAGPTLEFAIASALEEIIERHATMVWWMNRQPLPAVSLTPELAALWKGKPQELGQRAWLIHLDNEFNVPVMAGIVENVQECLFNIGFAARPDPIQAALKAWTEALTLQEGSRDLLEPEGLYRQAVVEGKLNGRAMKPWRADRTYLDDYDAEFHDISDLMCQQQVYLDPRALEVVRPWLDMNATRTFDELPRLTDRSEASYRSILEAHGYEIFYVDVTTPDVALTKMRVVRVVIPNMVPNFPAAFPFLGKGRIQNAAVELGWRSTPLTEDELNYFPLPHA